jgi:Protein of unknown function (DUF3237)
MSNNSGDSRRDVLAAAPGLALAAAAGPAAAQQAPPAPPMAKEVPLVLPTTSFVYEAVVDIGPTTSLGQSPLGKRRIVPILGGTFWGPKVKGTVLAGGADRQLIRRDGVLELSALYEMTTDDGAILTVLNHVTIDSAAGYTRSALEITAPEGPYDWLNRKVFVGTLNPLPERKAVLIRVFQVD